MGGRTQRMRRLWRIGAIVALGVAIAAAVGTIGLWRSRRPDAPPARRDVAAFTRQMLWRELQPVTLANCDLRRFGEPHDGGYLVCANLLTAVTAGYSYGISGYDGWGCEVATTLRVPVHQYDCFDTRQPACSAGTVFHAECVGPEPADVEGRRFDAIDRQMAANGDAAARIVLKMDVEGAEWESFLTLPDATLDRIDQLVVELHGTSEPRFLRAIHRLKQYFHVANLHMNNHACTGGQDPFPAWAYEVLFVNKRIASATAAPRATLYHGLDRPNAPAQPDCQVVAAP
jgi:hypothetical protein